MADKSNASGKIRITPLYGGNSNTAMCSLLELSNSSRLMIDCGLSFPIDYDYLETVVASLKDSGGVDAILLSHADLSHIGALPIFAGRKGLSNIPIICTLPVHKYSQLVLYDFVLNQEMEGEGIDIKRYNLDDVDQVFKKVISLKYSQLHTIPPSQRWAEEAGENNKQHPVTVEALPSGRTIGGTIWRIRCGPAEVLYSVDVNLRKETLLDAAPLDLLPTSPAVMICEASSASRITTKKKKDKDEITSLLNTILETVRDGGNVLIPCETAGRLLELLLILNKYWNDNHYNGLYHLILLSHMSNNILEFAKYQLEWMSDSLTKSFYNGKNNPFDLTSIKSYHDIRHMEKECYGPKVVIATDMSLTYGLSKELLLKWGGDKRCRVIFIDHDTQATNTTTTATQTSRTLAEELKKLSSNPPIICSVNIPIKIPLQGQELEKYRQEQEKQKLFLEEEILRRKRKDEISRFALAKEDVRDEEEEEEESNDAMEVVPSSFEDGAEGVNRKKQKSDKGGIFSYFDTNFKTFETKIIHFTMDEYGLSNDDLQFQDIGPTEHRISSMTTGAVAGLTTTTTQQKNSLDEQEAITREEELQRELQQLILTMQETPMKLIARSQTVQFTCDFKSFNFTGKVTFKAMKDFIHHINPRRLILLSGQPTDFQQFHDYYQSLASSQAANHGTTVAGNSTTNAATEVFSPSNGEMIEFEVFTQSLKLQIPKKFVPPMIKVIQTTSEDGSGGTGAGTGGVGNPNASFCTIALLKGHIATSESVSSDGVRLIRYVGEKRKRDEPAVKPSEVKEVSMDISPVKQEKDGPEEQEEEEEDAAPLIIPTAAEKEEELIELPVDDTIGVVSFKEITLMHIKQQLDSIGMKTEFHVSTSGRILVCNEQVMISTDSQNNFHLEGPPIKAFFDARRILYQQFAFL